MRVKVNKAETTANQNDNYLNLHSKELNHRVL